MYYDATSLKVGDDCGVLFSGGTFGHATVSPAKVVKVTATQVTVQREIGDLIRFTSRTGKELGTGPYSGRYLISAEELRERLLLQATRRADIETRSRRNALLGQMADAAKYDRHDDFRKLLAELNQREYV